jgi:hypothetical protein
MGATGRHHDYSVSAEVSAPLKLATVAPSSATLSKTRRRPRDLPRRHRLSDARKPGGVGGLLDQLAVRRCGERIDEAPGFEGDCRPLDRQPRLRPNWARRREAAKVLFRLVLFLGGVPLSTTSCPKRSSEGDFRA